LDIVCDLVLNDWNLLPMNLILIGPQGSGKGTQGELLTKTYNLTLIEMGSVIRKAAIEPTYRGKLLNSWVNQKGKLLPDGIVFGIFTNYLERLGVYNGLILDGYPRSVKQFSLLEDYFANRGQIIDLAICLDIPIELTIKRLTNRLVCTRCGEIYNLETNPPPKDSLCKCGGKLTKRIDDQPEAIKTRLEYFHQITQPLLTILDEKGILVQIDGSHEAGEVFRLIQKVLVRKGLVS